MNKILTLFFVLLTTTGFSQIRFSEAYNTDIYSTDLYEHKGWSRSYTSVIKDTIGIYAIADLRLDKNIVSKEQKIHLIVPGKYHDSLSFHFPKDARYSLDGVYLNSYCMVMIVFDHIYVYSRNGKELKLLKELKNDYSFQSIYPLNDSTLLFGVTYNFHPKSAEHKVAMGLFDLKKNEFTKTMFPGIAGIAFSHTNHNWIHSYENKILYVSDPLNYKLDFYNASLEKTGTFTKSYPDWLAANPDSIKEVDSKLGKDALYAANVLEKTTSRIISAYFISKDKVVVLYKLKENFKDLYYDVLKVSEDSIQMISSKNLMQPEYEENTMISSTNFVLRALMNPDLQVIQYGEDCFYLPQVMYWPVNTNLTFNDYMMRIVEERKNKNKTFGLLKFKI